MLNELIKIINKKLENKDHIVIAIDGMAASGKTTLANLLGAYYDLNIIHVDDFYYPKNKINIENDGNINYPRLKKVIHRLSNNNLSYYSFNCKKQKFDKLIHIFKKSITIVEGSYSLNPILGKYFDLSICLTIDKNEQFERIKKRNKNNFEEFINKWVTYENHYFEYYKIIDFADIIIIDNSILIKKVSNETCI